MCNERVDANVEKSNDENWPWEMSHFNQTQCMMGKKEGSREGEME